MKKSLQLCLARNQCSLNISYDSEIGCYYYYHYYCYYLGNATPTQSLFGLIIFPQTKPVLLSYEAFFFSGGISERYKMTSQKSLQLLER